MHTERANGHEDNGAVAKTADTDDTMNQDGSMKPDGREAEELRKGIERIHNEYRARGEPDSALDELLDELGALLEDVDARDSLAFGMVRLDKKAAKAPKHGAERVLARSLAHQVKRFRERKWRDAPTFMFFVLEAFMAASVRAEVDAERIEDGLTRKEFRKRLKRLDELTRRPPEPA